MNKKRPHFSAGPWTLPYSFFAARGNMRQEKEGYDMVARKRRRRFAVQLSTGAKDVGKVKSALMFATLAQLSDCDTVLYCVQDGADALVKGRKP